MNPRIKLQSFGAQLLQVEPWQLFYLNDMRLVPDSCMRGGQPILFPQFADRGGFRRHGFARDVFWEVVVEERLVSRHRVVLTRNFSADEFEGWPHAAKLTIDIECCEGVLCQTLQVENIGSNGFSWTGGLHPYFAVDNLMAANLEGLAGVFYEDRYAPGSSLVVSEKLRWTDGPCEKLFNDAPKLTLDTGYGRIKLEVSGFDQWMIWNPGKEGAKSIPDLPDGDWQKFVCIEPVCVSRPVVLKPGEGFVGKLVISVDSHEQRPHAKKCCAK